MDVPKWEGRLTMQQDKIEGSVSGPGMYPGFSFGTSDDCD